MSFFLRLTAMAVAPTKGKILNAEARILLAGARILLAEAPILKQVRRFLNHPAYFMNQGAYFLGNVRSLPSLVPSSLFLAESHLWRKRPAKGLG
ncbi:MAG: hypothetical protein ORN54_10340 [Cyclobacteriaceae bacterium]|nr:hypothetical protein [Cyclobacteriaceae bacterium]